MGRKNLFNFSIFISKVMNLTYRHPATVTRHQLQSKAFPIKGPA